MAESVFLCSCGETLEGPPFSWHFEAPSVWSLLSSTERQCTSELSSDQCVIEGRQFFIRGLVEIPVVDGNGPFAWGVWVSLSKANFDRANELWNDPQRVNEPSYFGWLSNSLPGYPETFNLKTAVHSREVGVRPYVEIEPTDHPLAIEQRNGITLARVKAIAEQMHHQNH
jgi:hypothetical protein